VALAKKTAKVRKWSDRPQEQRQAAKAADRQRYGSAKPRGEYKLSSKASMTGLSGEMEVEETDHGGGKKTLKVKAGALTSSLAQTQAKISKTCPRMSLTADGAVIIRPKTEKENQCIWVVGEWIWVVGAWIWVVWEWTR